MITNKRIVHHVNQHATEYYIHDSIHGWLPVPIETTYSWTMLPSNQCDYEYIELRHSMDCINGLYGHHVKDFN